MSRIPEPPGPAWLQARARLLKGAGRWEEAAELLRQAIAHNPEDGNLYASLAECLYTLQRRDEAARVAEQAIHLAPDQEWGYRIHALSLAPPSLIPATDGQAMRRRIGARLNSRGVRALDSARRAVALAPHQTSTFVVLAEVAGRLGRLEEARQAAEKAVSIDPQSSAPHNSLGLVALREGNYADAQRAFRRALKINPESVEAMNNLGVTMGRISRSRPEAVSYYTRAARMRPAMETPRQNILRTVPRLVPEAFIIPGALLAGNPIMGGALAVLLLILIPLRRRERKKRLDPTAVAYIESTRKRWTLRQWGLLSVYVVLIPAAIYGLSFTVDPSARDDFRVGAGLTTIITGLVVNRNGRQGRGGPGPKVPSGRPWDPNRRR